MNMLQQETTWWYSEWKICSWSSLLSEALASSQEDLAQDILKWLRLEYILLWLDFLNHRLIEL